MRILQILIQKLTCVAVALGGLLLLGARTAPIKTHLTGALSKVIEPPNWKYGIVIILMGLILFVAGVFGLLPRAGRRKGGRTIRFPSARGDVVIYLDSVEATLNRVVGKLPEVNRIAARIFPVEDGTKVRITADVALLVPSGAGMREVTARVKDAIADTASGLGMDDVTAVDLNVVRTLPDVKATGIPARRREASQAYAEKEVSSLIHEETTKDREGGEESGDEETSGPVLPGRPLPPVEEGGEDASRSFGEYQVEEEEPAALIEEVEERQDTEDKRD
ncbi:MAG: hypothetical protein HY706_00055 [Candidatus Hydrogenedentes bacterium]|nr:hypothetical protein [Candidatus Hydrogenedentota bacterium]